MTLSLNARQTTAIGLVLCLGLGGAFLLAQAGPAASSTRDHATQCAALTKAGPFAGMTIETATYHKSGDLPAHCDIIGASPDRKGIDGQDYAIRFHLRLPDNWNGRFFFAGGGGSNGNIGDALGQIGGGQTALAGGYAVVTQDSGHDNGRNSRPDRGGALAFGFDPQARTDFGHASLKTVSQTSKAIIADYYGKGPRYSYFVGCSKGGQEGMMLAQRYPDEFDGIIASAPGFSLPRAAVTEAWDTQVFAAAVPESERGSFMGLHKSFSAGDLKLVSEAVLDACDTLDGLKDGMVFDRAQCTTQRVMPELQKRQCTDEKTDNCLAPAQVTAMVRSIEGPKNSQGRALYSDWPWDAGVMDDGWRIWKIGSANGQVPPLNVILGGAALATTFTTPPTEVSGDPQSLYGFLMGFDFDRDAPKIYVSNAQFPRSAWMDIGARSPDLSGMRRAGGRLIVTHGASDPVFSLNDTLTWHDEVNAMNNGQANSFVRVFAVPGMGHCAGGPATSQYDAFGALKAWVETGTAPDALTATAPQGTPFPGRERPLCAHPKVARYKGGDPEKASSFRCEA